MSDEQPTQSRHSGMSFLLAVLAIVGSAVGVFIYQMSQGKPTRVGSAGFDISQTTDRPAAAPGAATAQPQSSLGMIMQGVFPRGRPGAAGTAETADGRQREKEFLKRHGALLYQYHGRLAEITDRYYKQSPIVRDVDKTFAGMERYMTVKRRYDQDGDPFQFGRDAIALPEVRAEISRRMADPQVWKISIGMVSEALKKQPAPAPIYEEAKKFMAGDKAMEKYIPEFSENIKKNLPAALGSVSSPAEMAPIMKIINDVVPQNQADPGAGKP